MDLSKKLKNGLLSRTLSMDESKKPKISLDPSKITKNPLFKRAISMFGKKEDHEDAVKALAKKVLKKSRSEFYINAIPESPHFKCVVVGDYLDGLKTKLLFSYVNEEPLDKRISYMPTVFDNYSKPIFIDDRKFQLLLLDTAGQEDYDRLNPLSYPYTDVFMLVFSVVQPDSLNSIRYKWLYQIRRCCPNASFILVGTEIEHRDNSRLSKWWIKGSENSVITYEAGKQAAKSMGALGYYEVIIKNKETLNQAFANALRKKVQKKSSEA